VTEQHLLDWRDALLASKLSPITVKDGYIAAAKAFFGWSKRGKKIASDPSAEVVVEINQGKHAADMRGFTDEEAAIILSAALAPMSALMAAENAAARRWVPWLCAYTGARVNEMTQLRACDVKMVKGLPCIHITPEAGTVKTSKARTVPLHPHLLDQGFFEFARRKSGETPLFYAIERQRKADRKNPTYKSVGNKLADWVRRLGVTDPSVAPNHGWRYRFKDIGLEFGMREVLLDVIQGHAPRTEGEKYINAPPKTLNQEIVKHPRYDVQPGEKRDGRTSS
jgi:integrase